MENEISKLPQDNQIDKGSRMAAGETHNRFEVPEDLLPHIPAYVNRRVSDIAELWNLFYNGNFQEIERVVHNIKGTGLSYGFPKLSGISADIDIAIKIKKFDRVPELLKQMEKEIGEIKEVFQISP